MLLILCILNLFCMNAFAETLISNEPLVIKGDEAFAVGKYQQALRYYQRVPTDDNNKTVLHIKIARCFQYTGINHSALVVINGILTNQPDHIEALHIKGEVLEAQQDFEQALALYKKAEALDPTNKKTYINLANVLRKMGRDTQASLAFEKVIN